MSFSNLLRRLPHQPLWPLLWLLGLAVLLVCMVTTEWFYAPGSHYHSRLQRELFVWPLALLLMAGYALLLKYFPKDRPLTPVEKAVLVVSGLLITMVAAATVPFHSTDVYGYINRGWQQVAYGTNPYVTVIKALPGWEQDPMLTNHWISNPCPYGFAFALGAKQLVVWGGGVLAQTLALFKFTNAVIHLGVGVLLAWVATKTQADNPAKDSIAPWKAFAEWTFHPLLLLHHLANGHNDVWMGVLLAGAVALSLSISRRDVWTLPAIALSGLIKYATLLVWPLWAVWLAAQRRWTALLFGVLGSTTLVWLLGLPYWQDLLTQAPLNQIVDNATLTHGSVHSLFYYAFRTVAKLIGHEWITLAPLVFNLVKLALLALLGIITLWAAQRLWQHGRSTTEPLSAAALLATVWEPILMVLCVGVGVASLKFYPWYLGMVLPSVLMLGRQSLLRRSVMAVALVQVLSITILGQARMADCAMLLLLPLAWVVWRYRTVQSPSTTC